MTTFGTGDYGGYNDFAFSGSGTFFTNWNTSTFASGVLGRITAVAARWGGNGVSVNGGNVLWASNNAFVVGTTTVSVSSGSGTSEPFNNISCTDVWQNNASYFMGFTRSSGGSSIFAWKDGSHGGYAGKSANPTPDNTGGTTNWGGTVNGGLPVFATVTDTSVYVKRAGTFTKVFFYVKRSGAWPATPSYVYVKRAGVWTILNELKDHEIPKNGEEALVDVGEGLEPAWIVEEGEMSWFGSEDPTTQSWDWKKPGHYVWDRKPWTGRYNSHESEATVYARLDAMYNWDKALRWENYQEADKWFKRFQPPLVKEDEKVPVSVIVGAKFTSLDNDPEPIMLGCNY